MVESRTMPKDSALKKLSYFKWQMEDYHIFLDSLNNEQMGELFFAIMKTAETGEPVDVSEGIKVAYRLAVKGAIGARVKYAAKCAVNAENGAKGGRKKAANAMAKKIARATFKPPSKTEFRNMAKHYKSEEEAVFDEYELGQFYDELVSVDWTIGNVRIESQEALDAAFFARFHPRAKWPNATTWKYFKNVFQLSDGNLDSWYYFEDCYNREQRLWIVNDTQYANPADAARAILTIDSKSGNS